MWTRAVFKGTIILVINLSKNVVGPRSDGLAAIVIYSTSHAC